MSPGAHISPGPAMRSDRLLGPRQRAGGPATHRWAPTLPGCPEDGRGVLEGGRGRGATVTCPVSVTLGGTVLGGDQIRDDLGSESRVCLCRRNRLWLLIWGWDCPVGGYD